MNLRKKKYWEVYFNNLTVNKILKIFSDLLYLKLFHYYTQIYYIETGWFFLNLVNQNSLECVLNKCLPFFILFFVYSFTCFIVTCNQPSFPTNTCRVKSHIFETLSQNRNVFLFAFRRFLYLSFFNIFYFSMLLYSFILIHNTWYSLL